MMCRFLTVEGEGKREEEKEKDKDTIPSCLVSRFETIHAEYMETFGEYSVLPPHFTRWTS